MSLKQVIVIRKDLGMRKGKMCAQAAHASLSAYLQSSPSEQKTWKLTGQTKICVGVESEEEFHAIFKAAREAGLPAERILDAGKTEFKEPTWTSICIGPAHSDDIDLITGKLKLL